MTVFRSLRRNAAFISAVARTLTLTRRVQPDANLTIADWIERWAKTQPDAPAILHEERIVTYRILNEGANRYARWAHGVSRGRLGIEPQSTATIDALAQRCPPVMVVEIPRYRLRHSAFEALG